MSPQLVADFTTQFEAMAAANRLMSCGLGREHVVVKVNRSLGRAAAGASTTTSVIPDVADQSESLRGDDRPSEKANYPSPLPSPAQFGQAQVSVALDDVLSAQDIRSILEVAGAQSIRRVDETFVREDPRVWPADAQGNRDEVQRAIEASRAGESMRSPSPK
ncbi:MAG: hypothetical protein HIU89_17085 [Proteobacteria bacterium]|nr:hypothetical protein [Pseudomonadota bacterium]